MAACRRRSPSIAERHDAGIAARRRPDARARRGSRSAGAGPRPGGDRDQGGRAQSPGPVGLSRHGLRQAQVAADRGRRGCRRDPARGVGRQPVPAGRPGRDVWRADLQCLPGLSGGARQSLREPGGRDGLPHRRIRLRAGDDATSASSSPCRRASRWWTRRAHPSPIPPSSTCCSTMRSSSRARPFSCRRAARESERSPSRWPSAIGCTVITTVGDDEKVEKARALGADHVINYRTQRFATITRKLTGKKGVDVVFEHVGADTWNGSLLCLKRGGRLVTCGSTSGVSVEMNLMQLFQQQFRITGSFGARCPRSADGWARWRTE